jgi:hypothetical protein
MALRDDPRSALDRQIAKANPATESTLSPTIAQAL